MNRDDIYEDARKMYESGYTPDDTFMGALTGVDPDKETKKKYYKDGNYSKTKISKQEAHEINDTIRNYSKEWDEEGIQRSADTGFVGLIFDLVNYVYLREEPQHVKEAPAYLTFERLQNVKKGKNFSERFQKEYDRVYASRFWAGIIIVLYALSQLAMVLYVGIECKEGIPWLLSICAISDWIISGIILSSVFSDGWNVILCFPGDFSAIIQDVTAVKIEKKLSVLAPLRAVFILCIAFGIKDYDEDIALILAFVNLALMIINFIGYGIILAKYRKPLWENKIDENRNSKEFCHIYESEILPQYEKLDLPLIRKTARKEIVRQIKRAVISTVIVALAVVLIAVIPKIPGQWETYQYQKAIAEEEAKENEERAAASRKLQEIEEKQGAEEEAKLTPEFLEYVSQNQNFYESSHVEVQSLVYEDEIPEYSSVMVTVKIIDIIPYLDYSDGHLFAYMEVLTKDGTRVGSNLQSMLPEGYVNTVTCTCFTYDADLEPSELDELTVKMRYLWEYSDGTGSVMGPEETFVLKSNEYYESYEEYINSHKDSVQEGETVHDYYSEVSEEELKQASDLISEYLTSNVKLEHLYCDKMAEFGMAIDFGLEEVDISSMPSINAGHLYANMEYLNTDNEFVMGDQVCLNDESQSNYSLVIFLNQVDDIVNNSGFIVKTYYSWVPAEAGDVQTGPEEAFRINTYEIYDSYEEYLDAGVEVGNIQAVPVISQITASSHLEENGTIYVPELALDGNLTTAWVEGVSGFQRYTGGFEEIYK